jgi:hypothetical protein
LTHAFPSSIKEEGRVVLVRVVGDALWAGDGEEVDEGLMWGKGGEEVTHVI